MKILVVLVLCLWLAISCKSDVVTVPLQSTVLNLVSTNYSSLCFSHYTCSTGYFCSEAGFLGSYYGQFIVYGQCLPCDECYCDENSIDGVCPVTRCPAGQGTVINQLDGSFFNAQATLDGNICVIYFIFEGQTFRQLSFLIPSNLADTFTASGGVVEPLDPQFAVPSSTCSTLHAGLKAGHFTIDAKNVLFLTYSDGYNFFQNTSIVMSAVLTSSCPNIYMQMNRSSIPTFIADVSGWRPSTEDLQAYVHVNGENDIFEVAGCDTNSSGFCLRPIYRPSLLPQRFILRRPTSGYSDSLRWFQGSLASRAWKASAASSFNYFSDGLQCTFILEQSSADNGPLYFRTHTYSCAAYVQATTTTPSVNSTNKTNTSFTTSSSASGYTLSSTSPRRTTTTTVAPPTTPTPKTTTMNFATTSAGPCRNLGLLPSSPYFKNASSSVLNCASGSINFQGYGPDESTSWTVDLPGWTIYVTFSDAIGLEPDNDYLIISAPNGVTYITQAVSDPTNGIVIKSCDSRPPCEGRTQDINHFNISFIGPLHISFISNDVVESGGARLDYDASPSSRRDSIKVRKSVLVQTQHLEKSFNPKAFAGKKIVMATQHLRALNITARVNCSCSTIEIPGCVSVFFQDSHCPEATATWSWLAYHTPITFTPKIQPSQPIQVDSLVYFERFRVELKGQLYVTASFFIYTPHIADPRDVLALFKGNDNDFGVCDKYMSFESCTRSSPFSFPPSLEKQVYWAYTSTLVSGSDDPHTPNLNYAATSGSVNFGNDVIENAGNGTYYVLLYSYKLKTIIAQVDYIQQRDCVCKNYGPLSVKNLAEYCAENPIPFPCQPELEPNPNFPFDTTGFLSVCPVMWFRNAAGDCQLCSNNQYSDQQNALQCLACPTGKYSIPSQTGTKGCSICLTDFVSDLVDSLCGIVRVTTTHVTTTTVPPTTVTLPPQSTAVPVTLPARFCGDGIVSWQLGSVAAGVATEQCDYGSSDRFSNLSAFKSVWDQDMTDVVTGAAKASPRGFVVCSQDCKLERQICGDKIKMTQVSPVYIGAPSNYCFKNASSQFLEICLYELSRDGQVVIYDEECDDGNLVAGDGCSPECKIERLFECVQEGSYTVCTNFCGDGIVQQQNHEQCDDGNLIDGDGCSSQCLVECGYFCQIFTATSPSVCTAVCGDGLVASSEACDIALVIATDINPRAQGCTQTCQFAAGWACTATYKCYQNESFGVHQKQYCEPFCGDGIIISPEACDDGYWNQPDKACLPTCQYNNGTVCYESGCTPQPSSRIFENLDLMTVLQNSSRVVSEGIILLQSNANSLSAAVTMFSGRNSYLPTAFTAVIAGAETADASIADAMQATAPICSTAPVTPLKSFQGVIVEDWKVLSNDITCSYHLQPHLFDDGREAVIRITISELNLQGNTDCTECLYVEVTSSIFDSSATLFQRFDKSISQPQILYVYAPATIRLSGSKQAVSPDNSILRLSLTFQSLQPSLLSTDNLLCFAGCSWNPSCAENCFSIHSRANDGAINIGLHRSFENSKTLGADAASQLRVRVTENTNQIVAMAYDSIQPNTSIESLRFPMDFSQVPNPTGALVLATGEKNLPYSSTFQGTWQGTCFQDFQTSQIYTQCSVILYFANDTIIMHVNDCSLRGANIGRIVYMDPTYTIALDEAANAVYYRHANIIWTSSTSNIPTDVIVQCIISIGYDPNLTPTSSIQILLDGGRNNNPSHPNFQIGGTLLGESNCQLLNLQRMGGLRSLAVQPYAPGIDQEDSGKYVRCNMSLSTTIAMLQNDYDCLALIRGLLFRDFWSPLNTDTLILDSTFTYQKLQSFTCNSKCYTRFQSQLRATVNLCSSLWQSSWSDWSVGLRLLKLLISAASALYWTSTLCASNQAEQSCAATNSRTLSLNGSCGTLLPQSIYSPYFQLDGTACSPNCLSAITSYIDDLTCCLTTIIGVGEVWMQSISHPSLKSLFVDFGDRTNPFNISFPPPVHLVELYFENPGGLILMPNGTVMSSSPPELTISAGDLFTKICQIGCSLTEQGCCNSLTCVNGNKPFAGSCSCTCPNGFTGAQCDIQSTLVMALFAFNDLASFNECIQNGVTTFLAQKLGLTIDDIELTDAEVSRRISGGISALYRMQTPSCDEAKRLTQKLASFFSVDVRSQFNASSLPSPILKSITIYCDGIKDSCGWSGNSQLVDYTVVAASCNPSIGGGNATIGNGLKSGLGSLSAWLASLIIATCIISTFTCAGCLVFKRKQVKKYLEDFEEWRRLQKIKKRRSAEIKELKRPPAQMVFSHEPPASSPQQVLVTQKVEIADLTFVYQNKYKSVSSNKVVDKIRRASQLLQQAKEQERRESLKVLASTHEETLDMLASQILKEQLPPAQFDVQNVDSSGPSAAIKETTTVIPPRKRGSFSNPVTISSPAPQHVGKAGRKGGGISVVGNSISSGLPVTGDAAGASADPVYMSSRITSSEFHRNSASGSNAGSSATPKWSTF